MSACRTFALDGPAEIWRAIYFLQKRPFENYAAIAFLKRHLDRAFAPAPSDPRAEATAELERAIAKARIGDCRTSEHDERVYRSHNVTRTHVKRDAAGVGVKGSPNDPEQQCQCDNCRGHRKRNARTGVASKKKEI